MSATITPMEQVFISDNTVREAQRTEVPQGASIFITTSDGKKISLSEDIQQMLLQTLSSVAASGEVSIGRIPEELTSTAAADILGISRPTLMKLARNGAIDSFKVRSHTRFTREAVFRAKAQRTAERKAAFSEFRSTIAENQELFED